ncbi:hypothetical protein G7Y89_g10813 [Cudoniella acicularis]|uniref:Uncharacterized protein n=1 Tax=Cudoniella acicularis TaxID=354080 RepID=A0A8H4VYM9_9HELO|nr:hypothetical protein G7Y89_g10813 [Cudoniella acicularis]
MKEQLLLPNQSPIVGMEGGQAEQSRKRKGDDNLPHLSRLFSRNALPVDESIEWHDPYYSTPVDGIVRSTLPFQDPLGNASVWSDLDPTSNAASFGHHSSTAPGSSRETQHSAGDVIDHFYNAHTYNYFSPDNVVWHALGVPHTFPTQNMSILHPSISESLEPPDVFWTRDTTLPVEKPMQATRQEVGDANTSSENDFFLPQMDLDPFNVVCSEIPYMGNTFVPTTTSFEGNGGSFGDLWDSVPYGEYGNTTSELITANALNTSTTALHGDAGLPPHIAPIHGKPSSGQARASVFDSLARPTEDLNEIHSEKKESMFKQKWDTHPSRLGSSKPKPDLGVGIQRHPTQRQYKPGRRQGPLSPGNAKKVAKCSLEEVCYRCRNTQPSLFNGRICNRNHLPDYTDLFFPVSHLQEGAIEKLICENVLKFSKFATKIKVSSGNAYPPMVLPLRGFCAVDEEFLAVERIDEEASTLEQVKLVRRYALPLGIPSADTILLKKLCLQHIKSIISQDRDSSEGEFGEISVISWKIFNAIERYRKETMKSRRSSLLEKASMLYAMHNFMGRNLTIVDGADEAFEYFHLSPDLEYDFKLPSTLLNRQLKYTMHSLLRETTEEVLAELEKELKTKYKKASWAPCLCTILILCMCTESLQVAVDGFAVHLMNSGQDTKCMSRAAGLDLSRRLDELLLADCKALFHGIHKSHKLRAGQKSERGFNPIRDGFDINEMEGLTQEMHDLVEDVHEILGMYGDEIVERAKVPSFNSLSMTLPIEGHMEFRERNSGRLVSEFLRSFLES